MGPHRRRPWLWKPPIRDRTSIVGDGYARLLLRASGILVRNGDWCGGPRSCGRRDCIVTPDKTCRLTARCCPTPSACYDAHAARQNADVRSHDAGMRQVQKLDIAAEQLED